jgi:hypothetical protein
MMQHHVSPALSTTFLHQVIRKANGLVTPFIALQDMHNWKMNSDQWTCAWLGLDDDITGELCGPEESSSMRSFFSSFLTSVTMTLLLCSPHADCLQHVSFTLPVSMLNSNPRMWFCIPSPANAWKHFPMTARDAICSSPGHQRNWTFFSNCLLCFLGS